MQTTQSDAFALKNSGLDVFLYADVGAEANGSPLTVLSILARLGKDPWTQAADWAALPTDGAVAGLSHSIEQMPLTPAILAESRVIAARLVQLLPGKPKPVALPAKGATKVAASSTWSLSTMLWCGVAVWMVLDVLLAPKAAIVIATIGPPAIPGSIAAAAVPLEHHAAIAPKHALVLQP